MNETQFQAILCRKNVTVVHFSSHATTHNKHPFPNDLQNAETCINNITISCHAMTKTTIGKYPGSVGLLLEVKLNNIISVCNEDAASNTNGQELSNGKTPNIKNVLWSLRGNHYNEWRVQGAIVRGIYIDDPRNISVKTCQYFHDCNEHIVGVEPSTLENVRLLFPSHKIYTHQNGTLIQI